MSKTVLSLALVASLAGILTIDPDPARAQSGTSGLLLGAALNGSSLQLDDEDLEGSETESGGGINLTVGYNFTPNIGVLLNATGANISSEDGDYSLGQADLALRYTFMDSTSAFRPYAQLAYTGLSAQQEIDGVDVEFSGTGFTGGAGFNYFVSPALALDVSLLYTTGEFDTVEIGGSSISDEDGIGVNSARVNFGVTWYPMARR